MLDLIFFAILKVFFLKINFDNLAYCMQNRLPKNISVCVGEGGGGAFCEYSVKASHHCFRRYFQGKKIEKKHWYCCETVFLGLYVC